MGRSPGSRIVGAPAAFPALSASGVVEAASPVTVAGAAPVFAPGFPLRPLQAPMT